MLCPTCSELPVIKEIWNIVEWSFVLKRFHVASMRHWISRPSHIPSHETWPRHLWCIKDIIPEQFVNTGTS